MGYGSKGCLISWHQSYLSALVSEKYNFNSYSTEQCHISNSIIHCMELKQQRLGNIQKELMIKHRNRCSIANLAIYESYNNKRKQKKGGEMKLQKPINYQEV